MKLSVAIRNDRLDAIRNRVGGAPLLEVLTGEVPAELVDWSADQVLALLQLPEVWLERATDGVIQMVGEWRTPKAVASGRAGWFRLRGADGQVHLQGTASGEGDLGELELENVEIRRGQSVAVTRFVIVDGNG